MKEVQLWKPSTCTSRQLLAKLIYLALCLMLLVAIRTQFLSLQSMKRSKIQAIGNRVAIAGHQKSSFIIMTASSYPYRNFVLNMACSLRKNGNRRLLVASMDSKMHKFAQNHGIASFLLPLQEISSLSKLQPFGSRAFIAVAKHKLMAARAILQEGFDILFTDSDTFWCADCAHELAGYAFGKGVSNYTSDLVVQRSHIGAWPINSGLFYARSSPRVIEFFDAMVSYNGSRADDDQNIMNHLLCHAEWGGEQLYETASDGTNMKKVSRCWWDKKVSTVFLNTHRFPYGCTRVNGRHLLENKAKFVKKKCDNKEFGLVHYSCLGGAFKKEGMKERGSWILDPETDKCPL